MLFWQRFSIANCNLMNQIESSHSKYSREGLEHLESFVCLFLQDKNLSIDPYDVHQFIRHFDLPSHADVLRSAEYKSLADHKIVEYKIDLTEIKSDQFRMILGLTSKQNIENTFWLFECLQFVAIAKILPRLKGFELEKINEIARRIFVYIQKHLNLSKSEFTENQLTRYIFKYISKENWGELFKYSFEIPITLTIVCLLPISYTIFGKDWPTRGLLDGLNNLRRKTNNYERTSYCVNLSIDRALSLKTKTIVFKLKDNFRNKELNFYFPDVSI